MSARAGTKIGFARAVASFLGLVGLVGIFAGCGGKPLDPRYPARSDGCDVTLYPAGPGVPVDNLGQVHAVCNAVSSEADCIRLLKDEACRLGGDVIWGVPIRPDDSNEGYDLKGRAAHTRK